MAIRKATRTAYFCSQCGAEHPKWQGQCRECQEWNTLIEERQVKTRGKTSRASSAQPTPIAEIAIEKRTGYVCGIAELDRVLGGSLLPGMTVLLGGEPGIGKSTLLLQAGQAYSDQDLDVLYVTGEESLTQTKIRAERLGLAGRKVSVVNSTALEEILPLLQSGKYALAVIDSIQTVASANLDSPPGTVGQIRETASQMITEAKRLGFALFLVGHVTKDGMIAGPKLLEHMVDTVIYFEGDSAHQYRILRVTKNRFGSVAEIGLFAMTAKGLEEVTNPSSFFLTESNQGQRAGAAVTGLCEGTRPLLVEIQALVSASNYGTAQRVAGGIDNKRLALLLAILEKKCGYPMGSHDVFVSVAGGLRLTEPAVDLAIMAAIVSSLKNRPIRAGLVMFAEVGLSGELRGVTMIERRLSEAAKLGFKEAILPTANAGQYSKNDIKVSGVDDLEAALDLILG
ncbi:MAG: DNA repair protein RadA [candidate division Zixibacteria bacterium]